tara:strand:- start:284 stop:1387 length:1104 start_codon:yes stop_codon:yes gene_type:complete
MKISDIDIINNKPILLYGKPGCGKTFLSLELLKDTLLLNINVELLKQIKDIKSYINDKISKKNITLMFNKEKKRGLLIDDIDLFSKYDKNSFKNLINFIKDNKFYNIKCVITCNNTFIKNKSLLKLKINKYEIKYQYFEYYRICKKIYEKKYKFNNLSSDNLDKYIYISNYNLNIFVNKLENCSNFDMINNDKKDNYDQIEDITELLLKNKYKLYDSLRLCDGDEQIISLNLLENSLYYLNDDEIIKIYNYYIISDIYYIDYIKKNEFKNYLMNLSIYVINNYINKYTVNRKIIYNKYISKTMVNMISLKYDKYDEEIIYLLNCYYNSNKLMYKEELLKLDVKELSYNIKKYEYFFNNKINLKMLCQ